MTIVFNDAAQGSDEWLLARRGACTGSRAKDARDRTDGLTTQQRAYVEALRDGATADRAMAAAGYKKKPTAEAIEKALDGTLTMTWSEKAQAYAMDLAREREGGTVPAVFVNAAMRTGTEQEPIARQRYEADTGYLVQQVGFAHTVDRKFGCSVDSLIEDDGVWECKTMVSSVTLFRAMVYGDFSDYLDQCEFELWLLGRKWCDLSLWCPDLQHLHTVRIHRDEERIQALEDDLMAFERLVSQHQAALRLRLGRPTPCFADDGPPAAPKPATTTPAPLALPQDIFA